MAQEKLLEVLVQPTGKAERSVASTSCVAASPSSVVKFTLTAWLPAPTTASISPAGNAAATTLLWGVAA
jgi:hypothetical protein